MEFHTWLIYLSVISAIIFLPGPSALLCISHGLKHGATKAISTVVGGAVAALILITISIVGLGAVLATSATAFLIIKLLGASYLIYLGISAWRESFKQVNTERFNASNIANQSYFSLFRKGFLVGISNPKDLLFFAALLPSFIDYETTSQISQYFALSITWFVIDVSAMYLYATLGCKISPWFAKAKNIQFFERVTGSIFITTGSALIVSSNK